MTEEKHTCECDVYNKNSYIDPCRRCGKPAKGQLQNGKWACGIHLAVARKRLEAAAAYEKKMEAFDDMLRVLGCEEGTK